MHIKQQNTPQPNPTKKGAPPEHAHLLLDARNHYPQIKHHTPPPKRGDNQANPHRGRHHPRFPNQQGEEATGLLSQSPIVCPMISRRTPNPVEAGTFADAPSRHPLQAPALISQPRTPHPCEARGNDVVLLRKEVIQPHLPVRLPCYDFVPIADPTFDGSLHKG